MSPKTTVSFLDKYGTRFFIDRAVPLDSMAVANETRRDENPEWSRGVVGQTRYLEGTDHMVYTLTVRHIGQEHAMHFEFGDEDKRDTVRRALRPDAEVTFL